MKNPNIVYLIPKNTETYYTYLYTANKRPKQDRIGNSISSISEQEKNRMRKRYLNAIYHWKGCDNLIALSDKV